MQKCRSREHFRWKKCCMRSRYAAFLSDAKRLSTYLLTYFLTFLLSRCLVLKVIYKEINLSKWRTFRSQLNESGRKPVADTLRPNNGLAIILDRRFRVSAARTGQ